MNTAMEVTALTPSDHGADRRVWRPYAVVAGWVAVALPFALEIVTVLRANHAWIVQRLPDDAFYYLEVGRRLGRGEGFTFDGIHETNGFHLLWQFLVAPLSRLFTSGDGYVKAALVLGVILSFVALVLVVRVVARAAGTGAALFGAIAVVHTGAISAWSNGMEGPVVLLTVALVLTALARWAAAPSNGTAMLVGALSAGTVLARFDMAAVIWIVPVAMAWRARSVRWLGRWTLGAAVVAVPVSVWWWVRWRNLLSTSATVKDGWSAQFVQERFGGRATTDYVRFVVETARSYVEARFRSLQPGDGIERIIRWSFLGVATIGAAGAWRDRSRGPLSPTKWSPTNWSPTTWSIATVAVVVALKAMVDVVSAPLWANAWYAAPQQLMVPFGVGVFAWLAVRRCAAWSVPAAVALAAVLVLVLLPPDPLSFTRSAHRPYNDGRWQDELVGAADWVRTEGPEGRYGAFDAGLLGFEVDGSRPLVNLDGLVNNYDMARLVVDQRPVGDLLAYNRIDYLVNRLDPVRLEADYSCAEPLWRSSNAVPYGDGTSEVTEGYVWVLDVRGCHT